MPASPRRSPAKPSTPAVSLIDPVSVRPAAPAQGDDDALSDVLARQLRLLILRGEMRAGARVNLDEIKGRFGVSLSPLREALSRLMAEGFVSFEAKRGFRVTEMSRSNLEEIYTLRKRLEPFALELSVRLGDDAWEERVAAALYTLGKREAEMQRDPDRHADWESAHRKFRLALISGCGMPMLLHFCGTLMDLYDRYRLHLNGSALSSAIGHGEYLQLFEVCAARDAAGAARIATEQLDALQESLMASLAGAAADAWPGSGEVSKVKKGRGTRNRRLNSPPAPQS